jgi:hypothetical protein
MEEPAGGTLSRGASFHRTGACSEATAYDERGPNAASACSRSRPYPGRLGLFARFCFALRVAALNSRSRESLSRVLEKDVEGDRNKNDQESQDQGLIFGPPETRHPPVKNTLLHGEIPFPSEL